jgi:hypothetical protein
MGGAQIYALALPLAQRVVVTEIDHDYTGDAYAPTLGPAWRETSRQALLARWRETAAELGAPDPLQAPEDEALPGLNITRPAHWGGYRLWADAVELWVDGEHRLHDRARWTRELTGLGDGRFATGPWHHHRLQP